MSNLDKFKQFKNASVKIPTVKPKRKSDVSKKDTFTFPEVDHALIQQIIDEMLDKGISVNKSEVVRAGLNLLFDQKFETKKDVFSKLTKVSRGRPKS